MTWNSIIIFYFTVSYNQMILENIDCVNSELFPVSKFPKSFTEILRKDNSYVHEKLNILKITAAWDVTPCNLVNM